MIYLKLMFIRDAFLNSFNECIEKNIQTMKRNRWHTEYNTFLEKEKKHPFVVFCQMLKNVVFLILATLFFYR